MKIISHKADIGAHFIISLFIRTTFKMKNLFLFGFLFLAFLSCKEDVDPENNYSEGKNYFITEVDGVDREYYVHVPAAYDPHNQTPVVFMLHGASGSGKITYNNSGWKELGESENVLTVFPTALVYCYTNAFGFTKTDTRWHSYPPLNNFCPDQDPKDDVKFLRQVLAELNETFNVNSKRIYMAGFSSGAQMTFRCAVEMSDALAAVVQSGGTHQVDTILTPLRKLPIAFELGNKDDSWFMGGPYPRLSLFDTLLTHHGLFQRIVNIHVNSFGYSDSYSLSGDTSIAMTAKFESIDGSHDGEFLFNLIEGLDHSYPNGANHPIVGANQHWNWMKQFSIP